MGGRAKGAPGATGTRTRGSIERPMIAAPSGDVNRFSARGDRRRDRRPARVPSRRMRDARRAPRRRVRAVGQDGRPRRRRRRAGPRARPAARGRHGARRRRSTSSCRATARCRCPADAVAEPPLVIADPRDGSTRSTVRILDVAADGYRLRLVDVPGGVRPRRLLRPPATTRGGSPSSAARRWRRSARDGTPAGRPPRPRLAHRARALLERARGEAAGDPFFARHGRGADAPQPRLPRLDGQRRGSASWACAGRPAGRHEPRRRRPAADGDRAVRARQHGLARVRRGGADAGVRHGPRRRPARPGRPVPRDPQRHRPGRLGPGAPTPALAAPYSRGDLAGKAACRARPARRGRASTRTTTASCWG